MSDFENDEAKRRLEQLTAKDLDVDLPFPSLEEEEAEERRGLRDKETPKSWKRRKYKRNRMMGGVRVYAEGDSWFHFPIPELTITSNCCDVLAGLLDLGYAVNYEDALAGSILIDMASPHGLKRIQRQLNVLKPQFFAFSGGGNDMVTHWWGRSETNLYYLLHPAGSSSALNDKEVSAFLDRIKKGYMDLAEVAKGQGVQCVFHSYAYGYPTGKGVFNKTKAKWFPFLPSDPYLAPIFRKRGYDPDEDSTARIGHRIVDRFHEMLESVKRQYRTNVRLVDSREIIGKDDWHDEYHLWPHGFEKVARQFQKAMS